MLGAKNLPIDDDDGPRSRERTHALVKIAEVRAPAAIEGFTLLLDPGAGGFRAERVETVREMMRVVRLHQVRSTVRAGPA